MAPVRLNFSVKTFPELAAILYKSIKPEIESIKSSRSKASVTLQGDEIVFSIESMDMVAARAAANTVIRLLNTSFQTVEVLQNVR
ncbi:MAG: KEOPS complex subunit Pcc1 [Candidatus Caldarchaeum sp.]